MFSFLENYLTLRWSFILIFHMIKEMNYQSIEILTPNNILAIAISYLFDFIVSKIQTFYPQTTDSFNSYSPKNENYDLH